MSTGGLPWARVRLPRRAPLLMVILWVVLVSTACLSATTEVTVRSDGSGVVVVEAIPGPEARRLLNQIDLEGSLDAAFAGVDGYKFEQIERADLEGFRVEVPFDNYRTLTDQIAGGTQVAGQTVDLFASFDLQELPDGQWSLDATVNPLADILRSGGDSPLQLTVEELLATAGKGDSGTGFDVVVSLPGRVVNSNASLVDGGTATWELDEPGSPTRLVMRTEPKPLVGPVVGVIGASVLVVVIGVVLVVAGSPGPNASHPKGGRRRKKAAKGLPPNEWQRPEGSAPPTPAEVHPDLAEEPALPSIRTVAGPGTTAVVPDDPSQPPPYHGDSR